jgi:autotransporter translocation and assembly factor TamB
MVVALAVHRPLVHWALHHWGTRAAERAGYQADWTSSGSVFGDIAFGGVRIAGDDRSVVRALTVEQVALEYDLWRWRSGGPGAVVDRVKVRRLEADIDLTRRAPKDTVAGERPGNSKVRLAAVRLPVIEIENVSLRLRQPNGVIEVADFSLTLDPARAGAISVARFSAPGMPELVDAAGTTRATTDSVTLENVSLWPETTLERLVVQWADLASGRLGVDVSARQGQATAEVGGWGTLGGEGGLSVEADATLSNVSSETLAFWGVPDGGLSWNGGELALRARGPVLRPDLLSADLVLRGGRLIRPGQPEAVLDASLNFNGGTATLGDAKAVAGASTATARGTAVLPRSWAAVADTLAQASVEFDSPAVEAWLPASAAVRGRASGRVEVSVAQRALTGATASVEGTSLVVQGLPVERVTAVVTTTDGGQMQFEADGRLNATNTLAATGGLGLRGEQAFEVAWKVDCGDLATVPVEARAGLPWPSAGTLASRGAAKGSLAAVRARDWARLNGAAEVDASSLKVRDGVLESLRLRAQASDGAVNVDDLGVRFDAQNSIAATGRMGLTGDDASVAGQLRAQLPAVSRLSGWSTSFGGPVLRGGSAAVDWQGRGALDGSSMEGGGTARLQGVQIDGVAEPLGLAATVAHAGRTISLTALNATAGPWRTEGTATWDRVRLEVPSLTVWLKDQRVAVVTGSVPMGGAVPLDPDAPVAMRGQFDTLDLDRLGANLGRTLPVRGVVSGRADFSGTLRTLEGTLAAEMRGVRPTGNPVQNLDAAEVTLKAVLERGRLTVEGSALQRPLQPLSVQASAPVDTAGLAQNPAAVRNIPLTGRIRLAQSSLAFLPGWVPALKSVTGTASLEATLGGTIGRPEWKASASVAVPEARLTGASLPSVRDVVIRIRGDEKRVVVEEAGVMLAGGRLRVVGAADLAKLADPVLDLRLLAEQILVVRDENLSLRANADIVCRGPVSRAAVNGNIDFVRGRVFKEIEFLPLSLPNQLPPPPPPTTLARSGPPALPPPFDAWALDLAIRTRDPIRLMGNVARGNVVADLRLAGTGARPVLTGRATLEQMWVRLPFSRLNITKGAIVFTEDKPFDPQIDVLGESITDGRMVQVAVQGRALDPRVRLTSSPPLSEGDIASLLATGVTTGDLGTRGDEAAGRAAFVLLQQTYRRMFRNSRLVRDDAEPPRLSFQFALFGSDPSRRGLSAVYELNPRWRVISRVGEAGTFRGLLHYLIRFR